MFQSTKQLVFMQNKRFSLGEPRIFPRAGVWPAGRTGCKMVFQRVLGFPRWGGTVAATPSSWPPSLLALARPLCVRRKKPTQRAGDPQQKGVGFFGSVPLDPPWLLGQSIRRAREGETKGRVPSSEGDSPANAACGHRRWQTPFPRRGGRPCQ